jgi:hypothetical protein
MQHGINHAINRWANREIEDQVLAAQRIRKLKKFERVWLGT